MRKDLAELRKSRMNNGKKRPARVAEEAAAARLRPFFFKMKLVPINKLDSIAKINPLELSDTPILRPFYYYFFILTNQQKRKKELKSRQSSLISRQENAPTHKPYLTTFFCPLEKKNKIEK